MAEVTTELTDEGVLAHPFVMADGALEHAWKALEQAKLVMQDTLLERTPTEEEIATFRETLAEVMSKLTGFDTLMPTLVPDF